MKPTYLFLAGLIALAGISAVSFAAMAPTSSPLPILATPPVIELPAVLPVEEVAAGEAADDETPVSQPAAEPEKKESAQPDEGSPSDRVIPPPTEKVEAKCGSEPVCCEKKTRCVRLFRCRSGCGLFGRR